MILTLRQKFESIQDNAKLPNLDYSLSVKIYKKNLIKFFPSARIAKLFPSVTQATSRIQNSRCKEAQVRIFSLRIFKMPVGRHHHCGHHLRRPHRALQRRLLRDQS